MSIQQILDRLDGVRKNGRGWVAKCPAHDDRNPSLTLAEGDDGRILVHCFTGCGASDVMEAIGLSINDLFPDGALRDHVRGVIRRQATHHQLEHAKIVLTLAQSDIARGRKLSAKDIEAVKQAHAVVHGEKS